MLTFEENYLRLLGQIGNFTEEVAGVSIIDAYFGPESLSPVKARRSLTPEKLLKNIDDLSGEAKEIDDRLRKIAITSDLESLKVVVEWFSGVDIHYSQLVEGIFGITPNKFGQNEIRKAQQKVEDASATLPGSNIFEKIQKWMEEGKISGETLKNMINTEIVDRTQEIERSFEKRIFAQFPTKIENKGVNYKTVTGEPWGANNYYQGDYTSVTMINIDMPIIKYWMIATLSHEYEHHVTNLCREKFYRENKTLDLAAALYHTKGSIIDEGAADCASNFLASQPGGEFSELVESLSELGRMLTLNVAYMLNVENVDDETAAEYSASEGFISIGDARKHLGFLKPLSPNGKPNFFKPYVYTYFFGKRDYVLPTFQKAQKKDKLREFFRTLYLNPYSRSTATWKIAFSRI